MSNALQVVAARQYPPSVLYNNCPQSPVSNLITVPQGYHAVAQIYQAPDDWCVTIEERVCICCCDFLFFPLCNDCGHEITLGFTEHDHTTLCIPAGEYQMTVSDEDGDPVTPAPREVVIKVSIMPGPCPVTV